MTPAKIGGLIAALAGAATVATASLEYSKYFFDNSESSNPSVNVSGNNNCGNLSVSSTKETSVNVKC